ncbi:MAG: AraC family transcriptional regulator [Spirochaetia bacterium]|nr:AraC family transcriptional regulator [Spirochaetia bacterium]
MDYRNYTRNISRAIAHIEKNIRTDTEVAESIKAAGMSQASFWRVFKNVFGTTLSAYKRQRKLTLFARRLNSSAKKISDICMEYDCDSPEIITRAFKRQFGVTPARYRKDGINKHFLERHRLSEMTIRHVMCGGISLKPRICAERGFSIHGYNGSMTLSNGIKTVTRVFTKHILNMRTSAADDADFSYFYAGSHASSSLLEIDRETPVKITLGVRRPAGGREIPAGKYAVFLHNGPARTMLSSYEYIFGYWMKEKMRGKYPMFVFQKIDNKASNIRRVRSEIYVPFYTAAR